MHKKSLDIIAFHGWGFDMSFWNPISDIITKEHKFRAANRGYFGNPVIPAFDQKRDLKVLMSHSFGLSWIPEAHFKSADLLIIFNGFSQFHPEEPAAAKASERILKKMIHGFKTNPLDVLNAFWKNTFSPFKSEHQPTGSPEQDLLLQDLKELNGWMFKKEKLPNKLNIVCMDADQDKILQTPRGKAFTRLKRGEGVYHLIRGAGHALPYTHTKDCWSFINAMIPIFTSHGNH